MKTFWSIVVSVVTIILVVTILLFMIYGMYSGVKYFSVHQDIMSHEMNHEFVSSCLKEGGKVTIEKQLYDDEIVKCSKEIIKDETK